MRADFYGTGGTAALPFRTRAPCVVSPLGRTGLALAGTAPNVHLRRSTLTPRLWAPAGRRAAVVPARPIRRSGAGFPARIRATASFFRGGTWTNGPGPRRGSGTLRRRRRSPISAWRTFSAGAAAPGGRPICARRAIRRRAICARQTVCSGRAVWHGRAVCARRTVCPRATRAYPNVTRAGGGAVRTRRLVRAGRKVRARSLVPNGTTVRTRGTLRS